MTRPMIHPADPARSALMDAYSLEVTIRDVSALGRATSDVQPGTLVSITHLPHESDEARVMAARDVRRLGFEPIPHVSARRVASTRAFETFLSRIVVEAGVESCLIVAGDTFDPDGPYPDSASLIATGVFERCGLKVIGVAGHPEGHPVLGEAQRWAVLETKCRSIAARGMTPLIVTQFTFDAEVLLSWLKALRARGLDHPVRIGVPGPANVATLMRFAARCGVGASASVLSKYGVSASKLVLRAGPDLFVNRLAAGLGEEHGLVRLQFYPFGGVAKTVEWIERYAAASVQRQGTAP